MAPPVAETDVCAPPELLTFIAGTVGPESGEWPPPSDVPGESLGTVVVSSVADVEADPAAPAVDSFDVDSDDVPEEDGSEPSSARATPAPWPVATATPTPSATASAPMRPMWRAAEFGTDAGAASRLKRG